MFVVVINTVRPEEALAKTLKRRSRASWNCGQRDATRRRDDPPIFSRADGNGNFAVVETDSATDLTESTSVFGPYFDSQIFPFVDIAEGVSALEKAVEYRKSIAELRYTEGVAPGGRPLLCPGGNGLT